MTFASVLLLTRADEEQLDLVTSVWKNAFWRHRWLIVEGRGHIGVFAGLTNETTWYRFEKEEQASPRVIRAPN